MKPDTLPEYGENPFVAALGPPRSVRDMMPFLERRPPIAEAERRLPAHLRRHCVMRVFDLVHPRSCQLELFERIDMVIRQGYKGRNPAKGHHLAAILDAAVRREVGSVDLPSVHGVVSSALSFALLGHPGMGKSLTLEIVLDAYPRKVVHQFLPHAHVVQVPWVKVDMPDTRKQFCVAVIRALGERVGKRAEYEALYCSDKAPPATMLIRVQTVAQIHALGVLVVDELQHLNQSNEGTERLMNFLVTLVNTVGVPVVLVGTMGATPVLGKEFRQARRASGVPPWTRLMPGEEWDDFVETLWSHQWTREPTPLTQELSDTLYDESQGIIDIAVKLFVVAQFKAIWRSETTRDADETIGPELLSAVGRQDFFVVQPMLRALRLNRPDELIGFKDLETLHVHVAAMLSSASGMTVPEFLERRRLARIADGGPAAADAPGAARSVLAAVLKTRGYGKDVVDTILDEVLRRHPDGDVMSMMPDLLEMVEGREPAGAKAPAAAKTPAATRAPRRVKEEPTSGAPDRAEAAAEEVDDLRFVAKKARLAGRPIHAALSEEGACCDLAGVLSGR